MKRFNEALAEMPEAHRPFARKKYFADKRELLAAFPRGRFRMAEDERCVLVSNNAQLEGDEVWYRGKGTIGLFTPSRVEKWAKRLTGFFTRKIEADGEAIFVMPLDPKAAELLPEFQKDRPTNPNGCPKSLKKGPDARLTRD